MTNPAPHGQVPEALIDLIDAYAETRHRYGRIHNARTEAARNAVIEALSEVRALSAAPEAIAKLRHLYQNMVNGAVRDTASAKRIAEGLLAPAIEALERATPPAEQQAAQVIIDFSQVGTAGPFPVANGRVSLPDATMQDLARMLRPTYEAEQQATTKAAPGEPMASAAKGAIMGAAYDFRDAHISGSMNLKRSAHAALEDAVDNALAAQSAPQQEAQEPVAWLNPWRADQVTTDYDAYSERGIPLYTAPQPAPLSESEYKRGYRDGYERRDAEVRGALV